jgi:hypothetical protein
MSTVWEFIEFVIFWVVVPCSMVVGYQLLPDYAASICRVEMHGEWKVSIDIVQV